MLATGIVYWKIIGIIIGGIVGGVLLLIGAILLAPVCYNMSWTYENKVQFQVKCRWLGTVLMCFFTYEETWVTVVKLFGIPLYRSDKEQKPKKLTKYGEKYIVWKKNKERKKFEKKNRIRTEQDNEINTVETTSIPHKIDETDYTKGKEKQFEHKTEDVVKEISLDRKEYTKKNFLQKVISACQRKIERVIMKCKRIWKDIVGFVKLIKSIKFNFSYYKGIWYSKETKVVIQLILDQLAYLYKKIKPKKMVGVIEFGTENPALTGELLAYGSVLVPFLGGGIKLIPYFDEQVFRGNMVAIGKIRVIQLVKICIVFYGSRELKLVIAMLNNKEKNNGRR